MRYATSVLVLLALLAALLVWRGGKEEQGASVLGPDARRSEAPASEVLAEESRAEPSNASRRESPQAAAPERESTDAARAGGGDPSIPLVRLRGVLRRSDDGAPAPSATLAFLFDGEAALATTDGEGRFATERSVRPGSVSVVHVADVARPEYEQRLELAPAELLVPTGDERGEVPPLELALLVPEAWITVEVLRPDGSAAVGAFVQAVLERREGGAWRPLAHSLLSCGAGGRARFGVRSDGSGVRAALLARDAELVSELVDLAPPWPEARVALVLQPASELRVQVLDEASRPVEGRRVELRLLGRTDGLGFFDGVTPGAGVLDFRALPPGRYRADAWGEGASERVSAEIELERGEQRELTLLVPRLTLALAAAGRVLDEEGRPLQAVELALEHESGRVLRAQTDAAGRFEFHAEPCGLVVLALDRDPWGDEYEPPRSRATFGTRELEFRRTSAVPQQSLLVEIVDAAGGERIAGAAVMIFRAPHQGEYSMFRADEGLAALRFKALDSIRFGVDAPGFRRRVLALSDLAPGRAEVEARIELTRGFERTLLVRSESGTPIRGAEVRAGDKLAATSDAEGLAHIDLPEWPPELSISAPGFEPARVAPSDHLWDLGPAAIELAPLVGGPR